MSRPGAYHDECGGYEYTGRCSVHRGSMSILGVYHDECGVYHEYTGGCSVHWGVMYQSIPSLTIPRATPGVSHILVAPGVGFSLLCLARGSAPGGS